MKKIVLLVILLALNYSCENSINIENVQSAIDFRQTFIEQVKSISQVDSLMGRHAFGEAYSSYYTLRVDNGFNASEVYNISLKILPQWKKEHYLSDENYIDAGGGNNNFGMRYQEGSRFIFLDIIAYRNEKDQNQIDFIINAH